MDSLRFADLYLAAFYTMVAVFYTVLIKHRSAESCGSRMVHPGNPFCLHWWNHLTFRIMRILIWLVCISLAFFPATVKFIGVLPLAESGIIRLTGIVILTLGFALAVSSNFVLNKAWRSGIDLSAPDLLHQTGLYRLSRNPGYIGVALGQVGFFLALPSIFTLFCLLIGIISLNIQIHLEEQHLGLKFKEIYQQYCAAVPRWL
ncbi:MAG: methyltransferase [Verrucomicrobiota bacterium]